MEKKYKIEYNTDREPKIVKMIEEELKKFRQDGVSVDCDYLCSVCPTGFKDKKCIFIDAKSIYDIYVIDVKY